MPLLTGPAMPEPPVDGVEFPLEAVLHRCRGTRFRVLVVVAAAPLDQRSSIA